MGLIFSSQNTSEYGEGYGDYCELNACSRFCPKFHDQKYRHCPPPNQQRFKI